MTKINHLKKYKYIYFLALTTVIGFIAFWSSNRDLPAISPYPDGKNFAFTITADPDGSNLEESQVIYEYIADLGMRTTIALWVKDSKRSTGIPDIATSQNYGDSCERIEYLRYMQKLQRKGFEVALHTVTSGNDRREETIEGYELFKKYFGSYPSINIMHSTNLENIYWGKKVVNNKFVRKLVSLSADRAELPFGGDDPNSEYFWGDIIKKKTKYVRLWGTSDIDTLNLNPSMPYHDPQKPYVNYWFSFSDGWTEEIFNELLKSDNIKKLVKERGACIVYTHFARNFVNDGELSEKFKSRMRELTQQKDGWFVPTTTLLDRLLLMKKVRLEGRDQFLIVTNYNSSTVTGVTILVQKNDGFYYPDGVMVKPNEDGEIIIEKLLPGETKILCFNKKYLNSLREYPNFTEKLNMFIQRAFVYLSHN